MLRRPLGLFRRTLGRTFGLVGSLVLKVGLARKVLLILAGVAALVVIGVLLLAWALFGG